jgi:dCMP deaminase
MKMTEEKKVLPRMTPDRDSRYMGLAWIHAAFSKDPSTQVGSVIVGEGNYPLGSGYNGPPRQANDNEINWNRPPKDNPDTYSKYDIIVHAEANAIDHTCDQGLLDGATLYCTALPCPDCMKEIGRKQIKRVVYMDYQSTKSSSLQNSKWRDKSFETARICKVKLDKFSGNLNWLPDWMIKMKDLGVFEL